MAVTLKGSASAGGGGTTVAASPGTAITVGGGKLIVVAACVDNAAQASVTCADNSSQAGAANVYNQRIARVGSQNASFWVFECDVTRQIQATDTITVTFASTEFNRSIHLVVDDSLASGNSLDVQANQERTNTSAIGGASITTTQAAETVYSIIADHASSSTGVTPAAGYTALTPQAYNSDLTAVLYKVLSSIGTEAPTHTLTGGSYGGNDNGEVTFGLKASAGGPINVSVGEADEADTAIVVTTADIQIAVGIATEIDTAPCDILLANEVDTALVVTPVDGSISLAVGLILESELAVNITRVGGFVAPSTTGVINWVRRKLRQRRR